MLYINLVKTIDVCRYYTGVHDCRQMSIHDLCCNGL